MIINLGCIKIDTSNTWNPVIISDLGVNIFFFLMSLANLAMGAFFWYWIPYHFICFIFCIWWPFMIMKGYTHKGLSHASYGLLTMIPHFIPMQIWGSSFLFDKIFNWNTLTWPGGKKVLRNEPAPDGKPNYWTDRDCSTMMVENFPLPKRNHSYPFLVGFAFYPLTMILFSVIDFILNYFTSKIPYFIWIRVSGNVIYFVWIYSSLAWLYKHPIRN